MARDRDIIIKSFSAGQTNTRAEKGFRMSKLLNVELDNFGDSISSMSGLVEDYVPISEEAINNTIIKKDDFVVLFYNGNIITIKNNIKSTFVAYQPSSTFQLSDAAQIGENEYIVIVTFEKHTEYIKLDLSDNSYSTFEPKIYPPFQYSPLANIESLKFIKKTYCYDYGVSPVSYTTIKNRLGSSFIYIDKLISETNKASYFLGHVKIEFNSEPVISEGKITIENNVISLLGSTIEVDGLRAIVVTVSASTNNSVELFYVMVDNAEADVASVILTSVKFDMFKWFNPTKVSFIRDRLTFYGFKENENMYLASSAGSYSNFSLPRAKVSSYNAIKVTIGAENFGTLVKITDDQNICFIGTKGIKSILTQKFNPLEAFDMTTVYKGYIDSFVPTSTGVVAIVSDSEDFYKSTIVHISYATDFNKSDISRLSLDSKLVKSVSDLKKIGEYSGFQRYVCKNDNGGWVQFYLSIKDKIMFSSEVELPAGSPLSKNSTINNIILYNARGILFLDDSNHIRYFKYHKIPIVGKILKPTTTSVDVPSFSDDEIGLIVDEDDITIYQGNNDSFNLNEGRQKILVGQTFLSGKAINSEIIIDDIAVVDDKTDDTILGEVRNIKRVTMKFLNKSTGVTVNDDKSAEKGLGYYEEHEAVIFTPNADLDLTARVKITNKDFGFFEIRMIIIFAEIGGNI